MDFLKVFENEKVLIEYVQENRSFLIHEKAIDGFHSTKYPEKLIKLLKIDFKLSKEEILEIWLAILKKFL